MTKHVPPPTKFGSVPALMAKSAGTAMAGGRCHLPPPTPFGAVNLSPHHALQPRMAPPPGPPYRTAAIQRAQASAATMELDDSIKVGWRVFDDKISNFGNGGFSFPCQLMLSKPADGYIIQYTCVKVNGNKIHEFWEAFRFSTVVVKAVIDYFNHPPSSDLADGGTVIVTGQCAFFRGDLPADFKVSKEIPSGAAPATKVKPDFFPNANDAKLFKRAIKATKGQNDVGWTITVLNEKQPVNVKVVDEEFTG